MPALSLLIVPCGIETRKERFSITVNSVLLIVPCGIENLSEANEGMT